MHTLAQLANAVFDHLVGLLLILQHHLHEVELALDEASCAHSRVNFGCVASLDTTSDSLQCCLQVTELLAAGASRAVLWIDL